MLFVQLRQIIPTTYLFTSILYVNSNDACHRYCLRYRTIQAWAGFVLPVLGTARFGTFFGRIGVWIQDCGLYYHLHQVNLFHWSSHFVLLQIRRHPSEALVYFQELIAVNNCSLERKAYL